MPVWAERVKTPSENPGDIEVGSDRGARLDVVLHFTPFSPQRPNMTAVDRYVPAPQ